MLFDWTYVVRNRFQMQHYSIFKNSKWSLYLMVRYWLSFLSSALSYWWCLKVAILGGWGGVGFTFQLNQDLCHTQRNAENTHLLWGSGVPLCYVHVDSGILLPMHWWCAWAALLHLHLSSLLVWCFQVLESWYLPAYKVVFVTSLVCGSDSFFKVRSSSDALSSTKLPCIYLK